MAILSLSGEYISRRSLKSKSSSKKKAYKGKRVQALKHNKGITEAQAKYILDMREAERLRQITRE